MIALDQRWVKVTLPLDVDGFVKASDGYAEWVSRYTCSLALITL
jgi:hypothetical protein